MRACVFWPEIKQDILETDSFLVWISSRLIPLYLPYHSSHLHRSQDLSHPIRMHRTDQAQPPCSRTRHCLPKTATIHWRARWASPIGRLLTTLLRGEIDYPTITPALSLVLLRLPPLHQMEMNPTTATQSKSDGSRDVLSVIDHHTIWPRHKRFEFFTSSNAKLYLNFSLVVYLKVFFYHLKKKKPTDFCKMLNIFITQFV